MDTLSESNFLPAPIKKIIDLIQSNEINDFKDKYLKYISLADQNIIEESILEYFESFYKDHKLLEEWTEKQCSYKDFTLRILRLDYGEEDRDCIYHFHLERNYKFIAGISWISKQCHFLLGDICTQKEYKRQGLCSFLMKYSNKYFEDTQSKLSFNTSFSWEGFQFIFNYFTGISLEKFIIKRKERVSRITSKNI